MFKVLLIDDDEIDRLSVIRSVQAMPEAVELIEAETAAKGIALAESDVFDCILLDYGLPDMQGIDVLSTLVRRELPVVILTGGQYEKTALETLRAGAQEYIEKNQLSTVRLYQAIRSAKERQDLLVARRVAEEEKFRLGQIIAESLSEICLVDASTHELNLISVGARNNFGLSAGNAPGLCITDVLKEFDKESFNAAVSPLLNAEEIQIHLETVVTRQDDSTYTAEVIMQLSKTAKTTFIVFNITDLTQRNVATDKIRQMEKMEALGIMTGGIAHDFNNMLTSVVGGLSLLERQGLTEKGRRYLNLAQGSVDRATKLTSRLLSYSRLRILTPTSIQTNKFFANMLPVLENALGDKVRVNIVPYQQELYMKVDDVELESGLLNICLNSRDAMPDGGEITITIDESFVPKIDTDDHQMAEGRYVVLSIKDTGMGMDEEVIAKVFEPFFTTKAVGKGSGLGLSMVFGFVRQTGGNVTVHSEVGKGTEIKLYFPKSIVQSVEDSVSGPSSVHYLDASEGNGKVILLVEDDLEIREFAVLALEEIGYKTILASDGSEAVELINTNENIDLLFTDIVMPGDMNGVEVAEFFREKFPETPVIYTSGYTRSAILPQDTLPPASTFLSKPYDLAQLNSTLSDSFSNSQKISSMAN